MQAIIYMSCYSVGDETLKRAWGQDNNFMYCSANTVATFRLQRTSVQLEYANITLGEKRIQIKEWNKFCYHIQGNITLFY